jgi:hypothetical protein
LPGGCAEMFFAFNPGDFWQLWQSLLIRPIRVIRGKDFPFNPGNSRHSGLSRIGDYLR